jgi:methylase of polypeptide subunit release factors
VDRRQQVAHGDWQTPRPLADLVVRTLAAATPLRPATIVEPTCGTGTFLAAAAHAFPTATLHGHDINPDHLIIAAALPAQLHTTDFFTAPWEHILRTTRPPLLLLGNLPWVTSASQGKLATANLPARDTASRGLKGLDARTGRSNFDISEWMLQRLLTAVGDTPAILAFLIKTTVARAIIKHCTDMALPVAPLGLWHIDAMAHFGAAVDAVLFACTVNVEPRAAHPWPEYADLTARAPDRHLAVADGLLVHDLAAYHRTRALAGTCVPAWRSGLKHDCAAVFELTRPAGATTWHNGLGEPADIEDTCVYPLLKSSDVAHARPVRRAVLVPQRTLGEATDRLRTAAPRTWRYLERHAARLAARKSSIYRGQPAFAVFGVGDYTFAPWKVAISGFYKKLEFSLVGPVAGRPVVFDDTCYFLPFTAEAAARQAWTALQSPLARAFFESRVFWAAKRPISKALLQSLDLAAVQRALIAPPRPPTRRSPDAGPLQ